MHGFTFFCFFRKSYEVKNRNGQTIGKTGVISKWLKRCSRSKNLDKMRQLMILLFFGLFRWGGEFTKIGTGQTIGKRGCLQDGKTKKS